MKTILSGPLFYLLIICVINSNADISEILDYLYSNKGHLSKIAQPIDKKIGPKIIRSFGNDQKIITRYVKKEKTAWEMNKDTVLDAFLGLCVVNMSNDSFGNKLIRDTTLIKGIVLSLNCGNNHFENEAFLLLSQYAPYPYLQKSNVDIITRVTQSSIKEKDKKKLISYCSPPKDIRKKLLSDNTLSLAFRARLGDEESEKKLIDSLSKTKETYTLMEEAINELMDCGSKKCLAMAMSWFNKPVYRLGKENCITGSLRESIIYGLQRYYPLEPLLNKKFMYFQKKSRVIRIDKPNYEPDPEVKKYLEDVVVWGKKELGISPDGQIGEPILFKGPCDGSFIGK